MSYTTVAFMATDPNLRERLQACAAMEGVTDPETWVAQHVWQIVANAEMDEKYAYAVGTEHPSPGRDEGVISDAVILAHVQPIIKTGAPS